MWCYLFQLIKLNKGLLRLLLVSPPIGKWPSRGNHHRGFYTRITAAHNISAKLHSFSHIKSNPCGGVFSSTMSSINLPLACQLGNLTFSPPMTWSRYCNFLIFICRPTSQSWAFQKYIILLYYVSISRLHVVHRKSSVGIIEIYTYHVQIKTQVPSNWQNLPWTVKPQMISLNSNSKTIF